MYKNCRVCGLSLEHATLKVKYRGTCERCDRKAMALGLACFAVAFLVGIAVGIAVGKWVF